MNPAGAQVDEVAVALTQRMAQAHAVVEADLLGGLPRATGVARGCLGAGTGAQGVERTLVQSARAQVHDGDVDRQKARVVGEREAVF